MGARLGPEAPRCGREDRFRLKLSYGMFNEQPAIAVGDPNLLKSGEPEGTRTQNLRLTRAQLTIGIGSDRAMKRQSPL